MTNPIPLVPHPWDQLSQPQPLDPENDTTTLDEIARLWREAAAYDIEADDLESEMLAKRRVADENYDKAEALAKSLVVRHPDWATTLLIERLDPRTV